MKNANLNLDLKSLLPQLKKVWALVVRHAIFIALVIVLLVYVLFVWQINKLASAGPSDEDQTTAQAKASVPRIDKNAIQQIQNLEKTNTQVQALFDQARNNPFQE